MLASLGASIVLCTNAFAIEPDSLWLSQFGRAFGNSHVYAVVRQGNDVFVGGDFDSVNGVSVHKVARWDGVRWWPLGSGISGFTGFEAVETLAATDSGVLAGGTFGLAGGIAAQNIASWNGHAWQALGSGVNGTVEAIAIVRGTVVAGGAFSSAGGVPAANIARWNGTIWSPLGSGVPTGPVHGLAVVGDSLFVGGEFVGAGTVSSPFVALWDGNSWKPVGGGTDGVVYAVAAHGSDVYVGGVFDMAGATVASRVARWNGSAWSPVGSGISTVTGYEIVYALSMIGSDLYVGGRFDQAGSIVAHNVAVWDGFTWNPLGSGVGGNGGFEVVHAMASDNLILYVTGSFLSAGTIPSGGIAGWRISTINHLGVGWNLVSLPRIVQDSSATSLYPGAEPGSFYRYDGTGYRQAKSLISGTGYWALYSSRATVYIPGLSLDSCMIAVDSLPGRDFQWVLLGCTSSVTKPDRLISAPPGRLQPATLYAFNGTSYEMPVDLLPGKAYWVLVRGPCNVTLRGN